MPRAILALALLGLAVVGCSSEQPTTRAATRAATAITTTTTPGTLHGFPAYAAVVIDRAEVFPGPTEGRATMVLPSHNENGAPQTLLIVDEDRTATGKAWYQVQLPVRPNGTTGWVRSSAVRIVGLPYRLEVHLAAFRLDLFDAERLVRSFPIGVGTDQNPTPHGTYYIKELLRPPNPDTLYGTYVFGLSGFSNVLTDWPGGGVLGIHGTNDPTQSIGRRVSHGCIRLRNEDIGHLAALLPLGTPVTVKA